MRFLLDECLSQRLGPLLAQAGHDVGHVVHSDLAGHNDVDVLEAARLQDRVLVSSDTDFGELLAMGGASLPSLILFRQGNRAPEHQAETLLGNLVQVSDDLNQGAIVVFTNDNIRIRRLPFSAESLREG
ncbi:MAG: DUF5615 family PIN-like protein [Austwickia sp.]|nr:DUF5615 family PIN-like protein [Actinomycetota bacterium]MCB1252970.1 DUF5615 family PIN-like protein [Austwickia sp.]MCO5309518.1 DUF5615 family PIN-like protein [Austwickia sp.]